MKVQESFTVSEPRAEIWAFFQEIDRVARCMPGVEDVEVIDAENSRVTITQSLGPLSATFDTRMKITKRVDLELIEFQATGRTVRGANGNVRATNTVRLEDAPEGGTLISLDADVALGGMLGAVGSKVVARQADQITAAFARALEFELGGTTATAAPGEDATDGATGWRRLTGRGKS